MESGMVFPETIQKETWRDVKISKEISDYFHDKFQTLLESFSDVSLDVPGRTSEAVHNIKLTDNRSIKVRQYNLPTALRSREKKNWRTY